jgi:high-affinity iron transporter
MNLSAALPTFLITLREGVEAALVVGIVLATLQKANRSDLNSWVYSGILAGIVSSAWVGVGFNWVLQGLENSHQVYAPVIKPLLEAVFGVAAIGLLSWMLVWMTQQSKQIKVQVEATVDSTLQQQPGVAGWGIFSLIGTAVLREGFETVLFIAAQFQEGIMPVLGAVAGILSATGIGVLLFQLGIKINLRLFFQVMGIVLLLIVGGLVIGAEKHLDAGMYRLTQLQPTLGSWCVYPAPQSEYPSCLLGPLIWDMSAILPDRKFPGLVLKTLLGYTQHLYLLQAIGYLLFLIIVGSIYFRILTGRNFFRKSDAQG